MSVRMIEACKRLPIPSTQKLVLLILADCHNEQTGRCDPSIALLEECTGLSDRAICKAIQGMESSGVLIANRRGGVRTSYTINATQPPNEIREYPRTTFASEPPSPPNDVRHTPEPASGNPRTTFATPPNDVRPNRKEPEVTGKEPEPSGVRVSKTDWRSAARAEADEASSTPLPLLWSPPLRAAVLSFFAHRHDLATKQATKTACKPWTRRAADSTVSSIETALTVHGESAVLARIQSATAAGWQGLNLDSIRTNGPPQRPQQRDERGQRAGEIRTDMGAEKVKDL